MARILAAVFVLLFNCPLVYSFFPAHLSRRSVAGVASCPDCCLVSQRLFDTQQQTTVTSPSIPEQLQRKKESGLIKKWSSTNLFARRVDAKELYLSTRLSFQSPNYFDDLIASMVSPESAATNSIKIFFPISTAVVVTFGAIVVPQLDLSTGLKNILGVAALAYPFLYSLLATAIGPIGLKQLVSSTSQRNLQREADRMLYHEAGHILVAYLCGVAITEYSSQAAEVYIHPKLFSGQLNSDSRGTESVNIGNLLVIAMAGVVAETLRCGDSRGGAEDYPLALGLLEMAAIPVEDRPGYLRWAVLKALSLLRINRNALDDLAAAMTREASVFECYDVIETAEITLDV